MSFYIPEYQHKSYGVILSGGGGGDGTGLSAGVSSNRPVIKVLCITDSMREFGICEASFNTYDGTVDLNISHAGRSIWHTDDLCATFSAKAWAQDILAQVGYPTGSPAVRHPADNSALLLMNEEGL